ncbi:uncharacterized protein [Littorina saxatilis]|uniref:Uncharacterized protein n=1 Tax=Littorina saxatilis TaxID=31220 RepID=A0AAN9AZB7_9CAEN
MFVQDDELLLMDINDTGLAAFNDDPDFHTQEAAPEHTVEEIMYTDVYICCTKAACSKKKYEDGECPNCAARDSHQNTARAVFQLRDGRQVTAFHDELQKLLARDLDLQSNDSLLTQIIDTLPIKFTGQISTNTIRNVVRK